MLEFAMSQALLNDVLLCMSITEGSEREKPIVRNE